LSRIPASPTSGALNSNTTVAWNFMTLTVPGAYSLPNPWSKEE